MRIVAIGMLSGLLLVTHANAQGLDRAEVRDLRDRVERLSDELADVRTRLGGAGQSGSVGGEVMVRIDRIEVELSRLTGRIEDIAFRQRRIAEDGARRLGALDLRLTDLEGGDISALARQPPLGATREEAPEAPEEEAEAADNPRGEAGGPAGEPVVPDAGPSRDPVLALAIDDVRQGRFDQGEARLTRFLDGRPGPRATARAYYWLGQSRFTRGQHSAAARSYLNAFNTDREGPMAARSLLQLGITLGRLDQRREACLTLREVRTRFPAEEAELLTAADAEADSLACGS